jgi:NAD(P)-dependent dehydrogenase (short-subunit alcohol dehydrogenase family)
MTLLGKGILVVGETSGIGFGVAQAVRDAGGWHCHVWMYMGPARLQQVWQTFEIGRGGHVANSNLGNGILPPETFDPTRRQ